MPKFVDAEARRREVTQIAAGLIVSGGRAALTVRNVAEAAGCSSTVVSHYFTDMADLFHETYSLAAMRANRRVTAVLDRDPADIVGLIEAVLPLDRERIEDWRIWFAFWSEALTSPGFANEQRRRAQATLLRIAHCLTLLAERGALTAGIDVDAAAHRLAALIPGIASEAIFDARRWTPTRQRRVLRSELALIGLDAPAAVARVR
jgi:AcrR family transcriptional regulator